MKLPTIEIMRPTGEWIVSELIFTNARDVYRFAAALGQWIGCSRGKVAAVRVKH